MIRFIEGYNYSVTVAYVAIPTDLDRDKYIGLCYKTSTISIRTDDGAYYNRVPIPYSILSFIDFPKTPVELGSTVLCINEPVKNQLFVIHILTDTREITDLSENQFKWIRKWEESFVEISGSAKDKYVGITVDGGESGGSFYVKVSNQSKNANIHLEVDGKFLLTSQTLIELQSFKELLFQVISDDKSSTYKQLEGEHFFDGNKFKINKADQQMLRGNKSVEFLDKLLTLISQITTTTALGQMPITNSLSFIKLKEDLRSLLSEKSFLE